MSYYIMTPSGFIGRRIQYTDEYQLAKEFETLQEASTWGIEAKLPQWTTFTELRAKITSVAIRTLAREQRTAFIG